MRVLFCIAALLIPTGVSAQQTTCHDQGSIVTCNTMSLPQPTHPPVRRHDRDGPSAAENIVSLFRGDPEKALRKRIGKRLAKGDCQGAMLAALEGGDMEMATAVRAYCTSHNGSANGR